MSDDQARGMRPETTSEHIARDMREGRFPEQSERQMVPVLASLPHEIQVWHSNEELTHMGTWATTRYPADAVTYVPKADTEAAVALALEELRHCIRESYQCGCMDAGCAGRHAERNSALEALSETLDALAPASGIAKLAELRERAEKAEADMRVWMLTAQLADQRATDLAAELAAANAREAGLRKALEVIREWTAFPPSGRFWRNGDGTISARPMPYGAAFGSNGERDFMRQVARAALAAENQRLRDRERVLVEAGDQAAAFDRADWFWRAMDPDDCGDSPEEAINRAMVGRFCVCEIASSYSGPTRYGFIAPVLDPESDDEEFVHFATQQEAIDAAKARAALASAPAQNEGDAT